MKLSMAFKMFAAFVFTSLATDAAPSQSIAACEGEDQGKCIGEEVGYDESAMLQVSMKNADQPVQPHNFATNSAQDLLQAKLQTERDNANLFASAVAQVDNSIPASANPTVDVGVPPEYAINKGSGRGEVKCVKSTDLNPVRCCSDQDKSGASGVWKKKNTCHVWGGSSEGNQCSAKKTFDQAKDFCASLGARLCTHQEVMTPNKCLKGSGCDQKKVWTSTKCEDVLPKFVQKTVAPTLRKSNTMCVGQKSLASQGWTGGSLQDCADLAVTKGFKEDAYSGFFAYSANPRSSGCAVVADKCLGSNALSASNWNLYSMSVGPPAQGIRAPEGYDKIWNTVQTDNFKVAHPGTGAGSLDCGPGWEFVMTQDKCEEAGKALGIQSIKKKDLAVLNALFLQADQQVIDHTIFTFDPQNFNASTIMDLAPQAYDFTYDVPLWDPGCLVSPGGYRGVWSAFLKRDTLWFNLDTSGFSKQSPFVFTKPRVCMKSR
jgi:hypothetical protein